MKLEMQLFNTISQEAFSRNPKNLHPGGPYQSPALPPPRPPSPLHPKKKSNSSFIVPFLSNLKHNIFICLLIIIEIDIYE